MIYDEIYNLYLGLLESDTLSNYSMEILGVTTSLPSWISHTCTIATLIFLFVLLCGLFKWLFNQVSGLFKGII